MTDEDKTRFNKLITSNQGDLAKAASAENPPSEEHLEGLRRVDEYSLLKHVANVKACGIYALGLVAVFVILMIGWTAFEYFCNLVKDTKATQEFLGRVTQLILVATSTLFLNFVITKKK